MASYFITKILKIYWLFWAGITLVKIVCLHTIFLFSYICVSIKKYTNPYCMRNFWGRSQQKLIKKAFLLNRKACGAEWARTTDSRIFSPMLYQLSYSTV